MKRSILFGIVCFREKYYESETFKNLFYSFLNNNENEKLNIYVYDNTDIADWHISDYKYESNINLNYLHNFQNPGISHAYNEIAYFAKKNGYEYIVFLDQDTELPINFYKEYKTYIQNSEVDIAIPIVKTGQIIFSPSKYSNFRSVNLKNLQQIYISSKDHTCINSGILIKTDFFFKVGGYDKRLRLDFCDHEFIRRVSKYKEQIKVIPIILNQMFSTEINSLEKALFRYKFFLRDLSSFKKINNNDIRIFFFIDLLHLIRLTIQYNTLKFIKIRMFN
ncbi:glycosyltransferase [uncultured Chryseobacterium sp.]|jgi:Predicted glycosyltransferases|uniref:glycosyltransferase n=1 Tax=uncultured Chryseobacterium sp. TaxID=259322 RepID=UPI002631E3A7|nr:glycosyltransferase [uncultured Chryseobacterium sp.]